MFQDKTTREFWCEYCPRSFSKLSSYQNHLRSHREQMYLDETGLSREENTTRDISQELNSSQEYSLFLERLNNEQVTLEDNHWQDEVSSTLVNS